MSDAVSSDMLILSGDLEAMDFSKPPTRLAVPVNRNAVGFQREVESLH